MTLVAVWRLRLCLDSSKLHRRNPCTRSRFGQGLRLRDGEAAQAERQNQWCQGRSLHQDRRQNDGKGSRQDEVAARELLRRASAGARLTTPRMPAQLITSGTARGGAGS